MWCANCSDDYHMDSTTKTCKLKKCICKSDGGTAAQGKECPANGAEMCSKCPEGQYIQSSDNECATRKCTCEGGTGATGKDCPHNGDAKCAKCTDNTFDFDAKLFTCTLKKCSCVNGKGTTGAACPKTQSPSCKQCNPGFSLSDKKTCKANVASTPTTTATTAKTATTTTATTAKTASTPGYLCGIFLLLLCHGSVSQCLYACPLQRRLLSLQRQRKKAIKYFR